MSKQSAAKGKQRQKPEKRLSPFNFECLNVSTTFKETKKATRDRHGNVGQIDGPMQQIKKRAPQLLTEAALIMNELEPDYYQHAILSGRTSKAAAKGAEEIRLKHRHAAYRVRALLFCAMDDIHVRFRPIMDDEYPCPRSNFTFRFGLDPYEVEDDFTRRQRCRDVADAMAAEEDMSTENSTVSGPSNAKTASVSTKEMMVQTEPEAQEDEELADLMKGSFSFERYITELAKLTSLKLPYLLEDPDPANPEEDDRPHLAEVEMRVREARAPRKRKRKASTEEDEPQAEESEGAGLARSASAPAQKKPKVVEPADDKIICANHDGVYLVHQPASLTQLSTRLPTYVPGWKPGLYKEIMDTSLAYLKKHKLDRDMHWHKRPKEVQDEYYKMLGDKYDVLNQDKYLYVKVQVKGYKISHWLMREIANHQVNDRATDTTVKGFVVAQGPALKDGETREIKNGSGTVKITRRKPA